MRKYPTDLPKRKPSNRLPGYDYFQPGAYFITICTHKMHNLFGAIDENRVVLNALGKIVESEWYRTAKLRANIEIFGDEFKIMPNHFHGIVWILDVGATGSVARSNTESIHPHFFGNNHWTIQVSGNQKNKSDPEKTRSACMAEKLL